MANFLEYILEQKLLIKKRLVYVHRDRHDLSFNNTREIVVVMATIGRLFDVLQFLRMRVCRDLPIQQAALLLAVAEKPGITMPELMQCLDMPQGTVSRNVKALSHSVAWQNGVGVPRGYGLLRTMPSVDNRQVLAVYLTGRGEALIEGIARYLGDDPSRGGDALAAHGRFDHGRQELSH